jgi:hypothetical protein
VAKGVEGFWLQALQNGRRTGPTIEEHDEPALKSLVDVTMEYLDDFQVRYCARSRCGIAGCCVAAE